MPKKNHTLQTIGDSLQLLTDKVIGLEGRFDGLEGRFDGLEWRFDGLDKKFDQLWSKVHDMDEYLCDSVATKAELKGLERRMNKRFDKQTKQIERVEQELVAGNVRFARIEEHVGLLPAEHPSSVSAAANI